MRKFIFALAMFPLLVSANEVETDQAVFDVRPSEIYKDFARGYVKSLIAQKSDDSEPLKIPEQLPYQDYDLGEIMVTITSISPVAFTFSNIREIEMPVTIERIEDSAFLHAGLSTINLPANLYWIGDYAFAENYFKEISIPESVYHIGTGAFQACGSLEYIEIKGDLKRLSHRTFDKCTNLKTIVMHNIVPPEAEDSDFGIYECVQVHGPAPMCGDGGLQYKHNVDVENCILYVPDESIVDYEEAPGWCNFAKYGNIKGLSALTSTIQEMAEIPDWIFKNGDSILLKANKDDNIRISDLSGNIVFQKRFNFDEEADINLKGIYIVCKNGDSLKLHL